jgi:uncharacterized protein YbjT (DUF2867 family)
MRVLVFGATGMVGQGVLRECLQDPDVQLAVTVGRTATGAQDAKLRHIVHRDLANYALIEAELARRMRSCGRLCTGIWRITR